MEKFIRFSRNAFSELIQRGVADTGYVAYWLNPAVPRTTPDVSYGLKADFHHAPMIEGSGSIPAVNKAFQPRPLSDQYRK